MDNKKISIFIDGKNVCLLPINLEHINLYQKWENDPKVRLYTRNVIPLTADELKKRLEPTESKWKNIIWFEIYYKSEDKPIGTCEISEINWYNRTAYIGLIIGEYDMWGKGICTEVVNLLNYYGFNELNMLKLSVHIFSPNIASYHCIEKGGYTREAVLKESVYINGKREDTYIYSLFKKDWIKIN